MAGPPVGPCEAWTTDDEVRVCATDLSPDYDLTQVIAYASEVLFALSGRQFPGLCEERVWPIFYENRGCGAIHWVSWPWTNAAAADWLLPSGWPVCGSCVGRCNLTEITVPGVVDEITSVVTAGVVVDPSVYRLVGHTRLVRTDGGYWPCFQDLTAPTPNLEIVYVRGREVPSSGRLAASVLAGEMAKAYCGALCALPEGITALTREGLSLSFADTRTLWNEGKTGLKIVDLWLEATNPGGNRRVASVHRADDPRRRLRHLS